jgi:N-acetylglucosaminyl-diphospho-decaprenol L-rhamnosyltransferase
MDVSLVVVTYNSRAFIDACLTSLRERTRGVEYEVIVVDNASRDGTAEHVRAAYPWARVIERATNGGLSTAVNEGVAASSGRRVMALNPDTRIESDALSTLAAYLDAHPDVGVAAPKLLDEDGTLQLSCRAFPGYATALFGRYSLLTRLFPRNRRSREYLLSDFDHASEREVDWASGAALMFPRAVFDRLGGWDAGFFMFNEDVDFCKRVHDSGMRVVYVPEAVVYHAIGVSKRAPARIVVERHKSMWRYYRKHMRGNVLQDVATAAGIAARCGLMLASQTLRRTSRTR